MKLPVPDRVVGSIAVPPLLLADGAYPGTLGSLKRFSSSTDAQFWTETQKEFDKVHSAARSIVENAFARLKGRWRILNRMNVILRDYSHLALCCFVLRNFIEFDVAVEKYVDCIVVADEDTTQSVSMVNEVASIEAKQAVFELW